MPQFEVFIPRSKPDGADVTIVVDVGTAGIKASEPATGRVFPVREIVAAKPHAAPAPAAPPPPRPQPKAAPAVPDIMDELFHEAGRIYDHKSAKAAAEFVLTLAMKAIKAESGAVYISSINGMDLQVVAARGPAAGSLAGVRVPMGQGTVGLAAQEGVAIAGGNGDACSPAQSDGRVYGAIQLLHKKDVFKADDMGALDYLAGRFAEYLISTGQTDA